MAEETAANAPLGLDQIIGASLAAVVQGETHAARATTEFLEQVGFTKPDDPPTTTGNSHQHHFGSLRMVAFHYRRPGKDGRPETVEVQVPLLSLVPIPMQHIKEATLDFYADIYGMTHVPMDSTIQDQDQPDSQHTFLAPKRAGLTAKIGKTPHESHAQPSESPQMRLQIKLEPSHIPSGFTHLFNLMHQGALIDTVRDQGKAPNQEPDQPPEPAPPSSR